jgi:hypothetical protein
MSLLRAPKLTLEQLKTIKDLLRLDYCRGLQAYIQKDRDNPGTHIAETCLNLLRLTDTLVEAESPLTITSAVMDMNSSESVVFPLKEEKYNFYLKILRGQLTEDHFPGLTPAQYEDILGPYINHQAELLKVFEEAPYIDMEVALGPEQKEPTLLN